jgi:catechol 2,3-dioxygenase-like lactoylglutathione lyase family enzyme
MGVTLDHTIVWCRDQQVSATFLVELFGLPEPIRYGPFIVVDVGNGLTFDYHEIDGEIAPQHYAFLVDEDSFDEIFGRIVDGGLDHWADPAKAEAHALNRNDGGRGVYFEDPDGHLLEIITRRYGSGDN